MPRSPITWAWARRPYIVPIPGTTKLRRLEENLAAVDLELSAFERAEIDDGASSIQAEGERYAPAHLAMVGRDAPMKA